MFYKKILLGVFLSTVFLSALILEPMDATKNSLDVMLYPEDVMLYPENVMLYPIFGDRDGDGYPNASDAFPDDPNEWIDTDHDGIGNNADKDDDGDGIPDSVEEANGLNSLDASDASKDLDKDGFSNLIEYRLGTNMRSASSHPKWVPIMVGDLIIIIPVKP